MRQQRKEVTPREGIEGLAKGFKRIGKGLEKLDEAKDLGDLGRALIELDEGGKEVEKNWNSKVVLRKRRPRGDQ